MDISYCDDKTGFPRPGHIYKHIFAYINMPSHSILLSKMFVMLLFALYIRVLQYTGIFSDFQYLVHNSIMQYQYIMCAKDHIKSISNYAYSRFFYVKRLGFFLFSKHT